MGIGSVDKGRSCVGLVNNVGSLRGRNGEDKDCENAGLLVILPAVLEVLRDTEDT